VPPLFSPPAVAKLQLLFYALPVKRCAGEAAIPVAILAFLPCGTDFFRKVTQ